MISSLSGSNINDIVSNITNNDPQLEDDVIRSGDIPDAIVLASELSYELLTESGYKLIIQQ